MRGWSHRVASVLSIPAAVWLVGAAPPGTPRVAAAVFASAVFVMFTASALVHLRTWRPHVTEVLFRLDHTGIFLAIAGTATPIALLGLDGWARTAMLWGMWVAALIGIAIVWWPKATPRGFALTAYITIGAAPVVVLPDLYSNTGLDTISLLLLGGLVYVVGAVIVALRRPDPSPAHFGYHEIWHLMVIAAVVIHYVMIGVTLLPDAAAA